MKHIKEWNNMGPQVEFSEELHAEKYRTEGESFREAMNRVSSALSDDENHYKELRDILLDMRFLPAGRIQAAMGSTRKVTPYNCFVSGTIEDSFIEGYGSIMQRATEAAATMRLGGGIGYDFSTLRPRGAMIKKLQSKSSGPISFMDIYNAICLCVASSGHRRGAQMGILRIDHPDIEEFIHAKQNENKLTGFNISVAVTDEFMTAVVNNETFDLRWGGEVYRTIDANTLWEELMRSTWDWAEPGVIFIDRINEMNNLYYCETIAATNPCGEQPLPPYGACLLGSFNLVKYIQPSNGFDSRNAYKFDWAQFQADIPKVVRAMDNVVDKAVYPLPEQRQEALNKRRMGLGITGLANAAEALGHPYGEEKFIKFEKLILETLRNGAYYASANLAEEKGAFPLFKASLYLGSKFIQRLPDFIQKKIENNGIRNSHLISIAPTGTISLCADNISSGIEPVFAYSFERTLIDAHGPRKETVEDYGHRVFGVRGKTCDQVTVEEHINVLAAAYEYVDSAVSKTCNVSGDLSWVDFKSLYMKAWLQGCKGCTTFTNGGKRNGILVVNDDDGKEQVTGKNLEPALSCYIDENTGRHECE